MVQDIEICFAPYHRTVSVVSSKFHNPEFTGLPRMNALK